MQVYVKFEYVLEDSKYPKPVKWYKQYEYNFISYVVPSLKTNIKGSNSYKTGGSGIYHMTYLIAWFHVGWMALYHPNWVLNTRKSHWRCGSPHVSYFFTCHWRCVRGVEADMSVTLMFLLVIRLVMNFNFNKMHTETVLDIHTI